MCALLASNRPSAKEILMLTENEYYDYTKSYLLENTAIDYMQQTRLGEPSRLVGTNAVKNVTTFFPSNKMGFTISTESSTCERYFVIEAEYDEEILEYWDQPEPIEITRKNKAGTRNAYYTPDFLVLYKSGPCIIEMKTREQLDRLVDKYPEEWIREESNGYVEFRFLPAEIAFNKIGLKFKVVANTQFNHIRISNLNLLLKTRKEPSSPSIKLVDKVRTVLASNGVMTMSQIRKEISELNLTEILQLIDHKIIYGDLSEQMLSQPNSFFIAGRKSVLHITLSQWKDTARKSPVTEADFCTSQPSELEIKKAITHLKMYKKNGNTRTDRRIREKVRKGKLSGLSTFESLLPAFSKRGNRKARIPIRHEKYLNDYIDNKIPSSTRLNLKKTYQLYVIDLENVHPKTKPVSIKSFKRRMLAHDPVKLESNVGGIRAGNAAASPSEVSDRAIYAQLPFETVSIDHYLIDDHIIIAEANGKKYTAKPWISVMVDICTGKVIAHWLAFRSPSRRACGMLFRDCVRRHGKLPNAVIVDRGAEFESNYFALLCASRSIEIIKRPKSHPKFGSEAERFFQEMRDSWLILKPGNDVLKIQSRATSSSHSPQAKAEYKPVEFLEELELYINWRNSKIRAQQDKSSEQVFAELSEQFPFCGVDVFYDENFILSTAVDSSTYKLNRSTGINIDGTHYWAADLQSFDYFKKDIEVRVEPENPYLIYVNIKSKWFPCFSNKHKYFVTKPENERLAEAIRVMDGRKVRDIAKEDADYQLIRAINIKNNTSEVDECSTITSTMLDKENQSAFINLFEDLDTSEELLITETWEQ